LVPRGGRAADCALEVLVTGHQGYLGTVMVPLLPAADQDVVGSATAFGVSPRLQADIVLNNLVGDAVLTGETGSDPRSHRVDFGHARDELDLKQPSRDSSGWNGSHPRCPRRGPLLPCMPRTTPLVDRDCEVL